MARLLRDFSVLWVVVVCVAMACAPPDPLSPDCACATGDGGPCGDSLSHGDLLPADIPDDRSDSGSDVAVDGDAAQGDDTTDQTDPPDGAGCIGEPDCPTLGVCVDITALCAQGQWVCDYDSLPDFELGGETLCDGKDNDCDGDIDEALPVPDQCQTAGLCADASILCMGGQWDCGTDDLAGYEAGDETLADGLDNDCDGEVDENWTGLCTPGERQCADLTAYQVCNSDGNSFGANQACAGGTACMGVGLCVTDGEFRVNEYLADPQTSAVVTAVGESVAVAWQSSGQDGGVEGVYYRVFDATGGEVLPETQANLFTTGAQQHPAIAPLSDDAFFIGWESNGQDGSGLGVYGRMVTLSGGAAAEVALSDISSGAQQGVAFAGSDVDGVLAVWADAGAGGKVFGATIGSQGWIAGDSIELVAPGNLPVGNLAVARLGDGKAAVVYEKKNGFQYDLEGRLVDGTEAGEWGVLSSLSLPSDANAVETRPQVAVADGAIYLAWLDEGLEKVRACVTRYDSEFSNGGDAHCADPVATGIVDLALTAAADGAVVLAVQDGGSPNHTVKVASVLADGSLGDFAIVDEAEMDPDGALSVLALPGGQTLVVWSRASVADGLDVWARFVQLD